MAEHLIPELVRLVAQMGIARSRNLEQAGFNPREISEACRAGIIEKVGRGLYSLPRKQEASTGRHRLVEACKRVSNGVLCLKTALWYHGLVSDEPSAVWMMIDTKAREPQVDSMNIELVRSSGEALTLGVVTLGLITAEQIRFTSPMKAVADCFKYSDRVGEALGPAALSAAIEKNLYNRQRLLGFAEICRVKQAVAACEKARRMPKSTEPTADGDAEPAPAHGRVWDREVLAREVWETPVRQLANKYGTSDNAVRKHCKRMGIALPGRGYWQKIAASCQGE